MPKRILLDVEADRAGNGVGHHQRRRREERLLRIRVDAAVEVAIARQHGRRVQVAVDDLLLDLRIERAGHAVAGGAGEGDDAEAELLELRQSAPPRRGTAPRPSSPAPARSSPTACACRPSRLALRASRPAAITLRGLLVLVQLVIAAMITAPSGILPGSSCQAAGDALAQPDRVVAHARVRIRRARHVAHDARQVELAARARTWRSCRLSAHRPVCLGVGLDQLHLLVLAAGEPAGSRSSARR